MGLFGFVLVQWQRKSPDLDTRAVNVIWQPSFLPSLHPLVELGVIDQAERIGDQDDEPVTRNGKHAEREDALRDVGQLSPGLFS